MRRQWIVVMMAALVLAGCDRAEEVAPAEDPSAAPETAAAQEAADEAAAPQEEEEEETDAAPAEDSLVDGVYSSPEFNIRFTLPEGWERSERLESESAELETDQASRVFVGPEDSGIQMVIANSESVQLVDASFASLNDRIAFDNVNIVPDRSERRTFNGLPGYRTEGDALLRGEGMPIYFIAQALEVPGDPVMITIFIPGDNYFEHSETMIAVLDSVEALDLRR